MYYYDWWFQLSRSDSCVSFKFTPIPMIVYWQDLHYEYPHRIYIGWLVFWFCFSWQKEPDNDELKPCVKITNPQDWCDEHVPNEGTWGEIYECSNCIRYNPPWNRRMKRISVVIRETSEGFNVETIQDTERGVKTIENAKTITAACNLAIASFKVYKQDMMNREATDALDTQ